MKRSIFAALAAALILSFSCAAADAGFLALTGLDRMAASMAQGVQLASVYYTDGSREFETADAATVQQLFAALSEISISSFSGQRAQEGFSAVIFTLSDGSRYSVRFSGDRLEAGSATYDVEGAESFQALAQALLGGGAGAAQGTGGTVNAVDLYLPSNPGTGYAWSAQVEREGIVRVTEQLFQGGAEPQSLGAGGTHWFHFDGVRPGVTAVKLSYARPWESSAAYTLTWRMTVDSALNVLVWGFEMQAP